MYRLQSMSFFGPAPATFYRSYEIGLENWLAQGATASEYFNLIGGVADQFVSRNASGLINGGTS